jgi:hypothetical protein
MALVVVTCICTRGAAALSGGSDEGCTPGYWKQPHHFNSWPAPYTPGTVFSAVFENAFPGLTLLQVLEQGEGHLNALGRHTVAALLNARSPLVDYPLTRTQVITLFNNVFPGSDQAYEDLKNYFQSFNEQHCPLNGGMQIGACCFGDGSCELMTPADCGLFGGTYQGDNTSCVPNLCPQPTGACCLNTGACHVLTQDACEAQGGDYQGDDTTCDTANCPQPGACCLNDGSCVHSGVLGGSDCTSEGGTYMGDNTSCAQVDCPQPGACCHPDGSCTQAGFLGGEDCAADGGVYQGDDTSCETANCPQPGACCLNDGSCVQAGVLGGSDCTSQGGTYMGDNTDCAQVDCPQPGACCHPDGSCTQAGFLGGEDCAADGGVYQGDDTTCDEVDCPQPGACCLNDGSCVQAGVLGGSDCTSQGGTYMGDNTSCAQVDCPQPGACCHPDGSCTQAGFLGGEDCAADGGVYQGDDTTCDEVECPQPGACCFVMGFCLSKLEADCEAMGGLWQGPGTSCTPNPCAGDGGEGCTPGYWKQPHHYDSWTAPYTPNTPFSAVFENAFPGKSLVQVLSQGGGGLKALGRHTVAALLNAASAGVDYEFSVAEVISMFNNTFPGNGGSYNALKDIFEDFNESGCPLNGDAMRLPHIVRSGTVFYDTTGANHDGPPLPAFCDEGSGLTFNYDVWRLYIAESSGTVTVTICQSGFDTRLAVYDAMGEPILIECNDNGCGTRSEASFQVTEGMLYMLRIGGSNTFGTGQLEINFHAAMP